MTSLDSLTVDDAGCILDGSHSNVRDFDRAIIALAEGYGFDAGFAAEPTDEEMSWGADEAVEWMNDQTVDHLTFEVDESCLFLRVIRDESFVATVIHDADESFATDAPHTDSVAAYSPTFVQIELPGTEGLDVPTAFDWVNSVGVHFDAGNGSEYEELTVTVSTGDPRGGIVVARLVRDPNGTVTLAGMTDRDVKSHEHYATQNHADGWAIRKGH